MIFTETLFKNVFIVDMQPITDNRGWFSRIYCKDEFRQTGFSGEWVQMNQSFTASEGTVRGMHYQHPPYSETKLVRCIAGKVFDVIIDLRESSETFMQWFGIELSAKNKRAVLIPEGFAHGFQTLEPNCELIYCHNEMFMRGVEGGIAYNDPAIGISWPLPVTEISERDLSHPLLNSDFKGIKIK
ncbi:dTDP-4-dehydrorhamnose 3,5-epimerase [Hufsiella ginkgonis]|uniref:dTDP-4-dehydrorhamnose 3,5-epimerase n=1 Tax=Hufsiella ginkgonis TaxID=2695274 RepID=A0A7K1Y3F1_9SPHI|nr:dTDP-4-dehydrorhamnose 3,5-epimerase [Hufsiella ginkgonis]MXV17397.1 dTDP-4-dehydrorhamnose 3,5-epimerase [Hufsiella ginkgonis]